MDAWTIPRFSSDASLHVINLHLLYTSTPFFFLPSVVISLLTLRYSYPFIPSITILITLPSLIVSSRSIYPVVISPLTLSLIVSSRSKSDVEPEDWTSQISNGTQYEQDRGYSEPPYPPEASAKGGNSDADPGFERRGPPKNVLSAEGTQGAHPQIHRVLYWSHQRESSHHQGTRWEGQHGARWTGVCQDGMARKMQRISCWSSWELGSSAQNDVRHSWWNHAFQC